MPYEVTLNELGTINVTIGSVNIALTDPFEDALNNIKRYWDKVYRDKNDDPYPQSLRSVANVQDLYAEVRALRDLIRDGVTTSDGRTHLASGRMARYVATIIQVMKAAGLDIDQPVTDPATLDAFERWQAIAEAGNLLDASVESYQSIQAMIENDYVERGNDVIFNDMSGLESSLKLTQRALESLTKIQDIHNMVRPQLKETGSTNFQSIGEGGIYNSLDTTFAYTGVEPAFDSIDEMVDAYAIIQDQRKELTSIRDELASLRDTEKPGDGSLEEKLNKILDDLPTSMGEQFDPNSRVSAGTLNYWIIDGMNDTETSAEVRSVFHQRLTESMTAASNLNDEQKANLKRVLFIFEEFYKSASAIMSRVTQLLEKMAQNISR